MKFKTGDRVKFISVNRGYFPKCGVGIFIRYNGCNNELAYANVEGQLYNNLPIKYDGVCFHTEGATLFPEPNEQLLFEFMYK